MHYQGIFFDFDYTLGDSTIPILRGYQEGFRALGWDAPTLEQVRPTIGMTLMEGYRQLTGDQDSGRADEFYHLIVGGRDVKRNKPDPEGLHLAMTKLGLKPEQVLFCGDTVIDAQAAKSAGVDFCAVLNGTTPGEAFDGYPHVHIAQDLWDVKKWLGV